MFISDSSGSQRKCKIFNLPDMFHCFILFLIGFVRILSIQRTGRPSAGCVPAGSGAPRCMMSFISTHSHIGLRVTWSCRVDPRACLHSVHSDFTAYTRVCDLIYYLYQLAIKQFTQHGQQQGYKVWICRGGSEKGKF